MPKPVYVLVGVLFLTMACSSSSSHYTRKERSINWFDRLRYIAWNGDNVVSYRIAFLKDRSFIYTIEEPGDDHPKMITGYHGHISNSNDTLHLLFAGKKRPPMCDYLVRESTGQYVIQYFKDGRKRMFLRIYPFPPGQR